MYNSNELTNEDPSWLSIADLMSILMFIFLFATVFFMPKIGNDNKPIDNDKYNKIGNAIMKIDQNKANLYKSLYNGFKSYLGKWNAEIDSTLSIRFIANEVLFGVDSSVLKEDFKKILGDFFPVFIDTLWKYREIIDGVVIEGHTSSEWNNNTSIQDAFLANMRLSHDRARSVLEFCIRNYPEEKGLEKREWIKNYLTASGLSSSRLIYNNGYEDKFKSRRVEFRIRTNSEIELRKIFDEIQYNYVQ